MKIIFDIVHPGEIAAGIRGFTDLVSVDVDSGNPGGEAGEFEERIRQALIEWYDGARVMLVKTEGGQK